MEEFQAGIKKRIFALQALTAFSLIFVLWSTSYGASLWEKTNDFTHGIQVGIFIGLEALAVIKGNKLRKVLKNQEALKSLYIEEHDERKKMIQEKSGSTGFVLIMISMAAGTVISGFFNYTVFLTLLCSLFFILLVKVAMKGFFAKEY